MKTAIVFAGGDPPPVEVTQRLPEGALIIAADSGFDHARSLGVAVDLLIGDLDSISDEGLALASNTEIERHPSDKDTSDLTLALRAAVARGGQRLIVVGGEGGRIDHFLTNSAVITSNEFSAHRIEWWIGSSRILVVRSETTIEGRAGDIVTVLAQGGDAEGVTTTGLRWPLALQTLEHGSSRGLSNQMTGNVASVSVRSGIVLAVHVPGPHR